MTGRTAKLATGTAAVALGLLVSACSGGGGGISGLSIGGKKKANKSTDSTSHVAALSDDEAIQFFKDNCNSCHGKGQDLHSTWPLPDQDTLSLATLQSIDTISDAYQALVNKATKGKTTPSPMPPTKLDADATAALNGLIYWFQLNMPEVVKQAADTYGATDQFGSTLDVNLTYQCAGRTTGRNYLFRLFNEALGRFPTEDEINQYLPAGEREAAITDARRDTLAKLVTLGDLKEDFKKYGLKLFGERIAGAGSIKPDAAFGISDAAATDLQDEFYQLLLKYVEDKPYKEILLMNKVEVTANTADFYNDPTAPCTKPAPNTWAECQLSNQRSDFFGTVAFLKSNPSSFLASNNNYKRGGAIHAILKGEKLMAQTDGPKGQKPDPMPDCFNTADKRMVLADPKKADGDKAPRGSFAVPRSGAICQGCHLKKYVGMASYVFRPFDANGIKFPATAFDVNEPKNPYADQVKAATDQSIVNVSDESQPGTGVDVALLQALLQENATDQQMCISNTAATKTLANISVIGDLIKYMIGDGTVLVNGLARFIPSALSNLPLTNQEVITGISKGFDQNGGKLLPVFKAYFESETFSCAVQDK